MRQACFFVYEDEKDKKQPWSGSYRTGGAVLLQATFDNVSRLVGVTTG